MHKIMKLVRISFLPGIMSLITLLCLEANAQDYIASSQGQVVASISDKGVNRIAIGNDRITQVIGNEEEYIIESDANLGQVFLTPILKEPKEISVKLVTERDKIIDVKFKIKRIEPQTINIKYKNSSNSTSSSPVNDFSVNSNVINNNQMSGNAETQQVIDNLKLAYSNKLQGIKVPTLGCLKENIKFNKLKLVEATQYSVNKQIIVKAVISNPKKNESLLLNESDFSNCMALVKAVSIDNNQLMSGMKSTIYMVGKDGK